MRDGRGAFWTPAHHAQMLSLRSHEDASSVARLHDLVSDVAHQIFLNLKAPRVGFDQARQLSEPEDPVARDVANADMPEERQEVVGTNRVEPDVLDLHFAWRFACVEVARSREDRRRIDLVPAQQFFVATRDSSFRIRRIEPAQRPWVIGDVLGEPGCEFQVDLLSERSSQDQSPSRSSSGFIQPVLMQ